MVKLRTWFICIVTCLDSLPPQLTSSMFQLIREHKPTLEAHDSEPAPMRAQTHLPAACPIRQLRRNTTCFSNLHPLTYLKAVSPSSGIPITNDGQAPIRFTALVVWLDGANWALEWARGSNERGGVLRFVEAG